MSILEGWSVWGPQGVVTPVSADAVRAAIEAGHVKRGFLVKHEYDEEWQPVELSMFGAWLPVARPSKPLLSYFPSLVFAAMWAFMAWSVVDFLAYVNSPTLTAWVGGTVCFLVVFVLSLRVRAGR